jgi:CheY-like chemotaxis protein
VAKVLLVEDNPDDLEVYRTLLYHSGFEVVTAEDGDSAIEMAIAEQPDVIVIDVMLPRLNGLVATQRIQMNEQTAHIPIICMSAYELSPTMVKYSGACELLQKPVSGETLVRTIRKYIGWDDAPPPDRPRY